MLRPLCSRWRSWWYWPYGRLKTFQTCIVWGGLWVIIGHHLGFYPRRPSLFTDSTKEIILKQIRGNGRRYINAYRIFVCRTEERTTTYTQRACGRTIHGQHFTWRIASLFTQTVSRDGTQHSDRRHCGFPWVVFHAVSFSVLQLLQMCFFCSQTLMTCDKHFFQWKSKFFKLSEPTGSDWRLLSNKIIFLYHMDVINVV
jgi:hypothetical protein